MSLKEFSAQLRADRVDAGLCPAADAIPVWPLSLRPYTQSRVPLHLPSFLPSLSLVHLCIYLINFLMGVVRQGLTM